MIHTESCFCSVMHKNSHKLYSHMKKDIFLVTASKQRMACDNIDNRMQSLCGLQFAGVSWRLNAEAFIVSTTDPKHHSNDAQHTTVELIAFLAWILLSLRVNLNYSREKRLELAPYFITQRVLKDLTQILLTLETFSEGLPLLKRRKYAKWHQFITFVIFVHSFPLFLSSFTAFRIEKWFLNWIKTGDGGIGSSSPWMIFQHLFQSLNMDFGLLKWETFH